MTWREYAKAEREALIAEVLGTGPMTATGIARQVYGITTTEKIPRSLTARVTQSLRVMEREGIVKRSQGKRVLDWRIARLYQAKRPPAAGCLLAGGHFFATKQPHGVPGLLSSWSMPESRSHPGK